MSRSRTPAGRAVAETAPAAESVRASRLLHIGVADLAAAAEAVAARRLLARAVSESAPATDSARITGKHHHGGRPEWHTGIGLLESDPAPGGLLRSGEARSGELAAAGARPGGALSPGPGRPGGRLSGTNEEAP